MAALNKFWIFTLLFLISIVSVNAFSCVDGYGIGVSQRGPANGVIYTVGTPVNPYWDGSGRIVFSIDVTNIHGLFSSLAPYNNCNYTNVYAKWFWDSQFDVTSISGVNTVGTDYRTNSVPLQLVPGSYTWEAGHSPSACIGGYSPVGCYTSLNSLTIQGQTCAQPNLRQMFINTTYPGGTSSINFNCTGECPDTQGCTLYFYDDNNNQMGGTDHINYCTSSNCFNKQRTYSGLVDGNSYNVRCQIVTDTPGCGRTDSISRSFTVGGSSCPSITSTFPSPTPQQGSTVSNETNTVRIGTQSQYSAVVDITLYYCENTGNCNLATCDPASGTMLPLAFQNVGTTRTYVNIPIISTAGNCVRWYTRYDYENPTPCTPLYPRSINPGSVGWYYVNGTVPGLNVTLISPLNNTQIPISNVPLDFTFTVQATVGTTTDTLYIDGSPVTSGVKPTGLTSFPNVNVGSGIHTWYVTANDGFSTAQSQTWRFTVVQGPSVNLISPADGYQYANGQTSTSSSPLTWTVSASTSTIDKLIINGITTQTLPATSQFTRTANMAIQGGLVYNWQINSTDTNGLSTLTPSRSFQINCSTIWQKQDISCGMDNRRIIGYVDINNCAFPTIPVPADNGTYEPCVYCRNEWDCTLYETCQINNTQRCLNVTNIGMIPCANATPSISDIRGKDKTCLFETGVDKIDFSSNELVDVNDPFNKGILPDIYFGIIAWMSTPFLYWLLLIIAALCLFLTAVAVLYWVRNMQ